MKKYIKDKMYNPGDYFVIDNKVIEVIAGDTCKDCAFVDSDECRNTPCTGIAFKHVFNIPKKEK